MINACFKTNWLRARIRFAPGESRIDSRKQKSGRSCNFEETWRARIDAMPPAGNELGERRREVSQ